MINKKPNKVINIKRKGHDVYVTPFLVRDLDKSKCSYKFIQRINNGDLSDDDIVYVKCYITGEIDFRGKKEEYRILPNKEVQ